MRLRTVLQNLQFDDASAHKQSAFAKATADKKGRLPNTLKK
jgi:hypothetical protein